MKKIISLIASVAMLASMVTSVSAAELANNANPVVDVSIVEELSAESYYDWTELELPADEKAYLVDVTVNNVDLSSKASSKSGSNKSNRDGVIMMVTELYLEVDNASNVTSVAAMECGNSNAGYNADIEDNTITCTFLASTSKQGAPEVNDGVTTAVTADSVLAVEFIITVKGNVTATINQEPMLKFSNFTTGKAEGVENTMNFGASAANHATWTVNGEEGSSITFVATEEPPVDPEPPVTPEEPKDIIISDPMNLVTENGDIGTAWDVTINNFDDAVDYVAIFTDVDNNTTRDGGQVIKFEAEVKDGKIAFATILNQSQARTVSLNIEKK